MGLETKKKRFKNYRVIVDLSLRIDIYLIQTFFELFKYLEPNSPRVKFFLENFVSRGKSK